MARFYRTLAIVVAVYAILHPVVHFATLAAHAPALPDPGAAGWTAEDVEFEHDGQRYRAASTDGTPLLSQHLYYVPTFDPTSILHAALATAALLGASALLAIAAAQHGPRATERT